MLPRSASRDQLGGLVSYRLLVLWWQDGIELVQRRKGLPVYHQPVTGHGLRRTSPVHTNYWPSRAGFNSGMQSNISSILKDNAIVVCNNKELCKESVERKSNGIIPV